MLETHGKTAEQIAKSLDMSTPEVTLRTEAALALARGMAGLGLIGLRKRRDELNQLIAKLEADQAVIDNAKSLAEGRIT